MDIFLQAFLDKGWLAALPPQPWVVVERFVREVAHGDLTKILSFLPPALVAQIGVEKLDSIFRSNTEEVKSRGGIVEVEVEDQWEDFESAAVDVSMTYGDGSTDKEVILLVRDMNEWKIDLTR